MLKRSRVGAIFVNKETLGGEAHYNRTFGADANLMLGKGLQATSFVAKTDTPGLTGNDMAFFGRVAYRDPAWNVWLNYLDVQDNFNAEVGLVQRRGVKTTKAYFSPTPRPGKAGIRMLEPMAVLTYITDQQNRMVGRTQHFMNGFYMQDGSFINVIYQRNLDVLDAPFRIAGSHDSGRRLQIRRGVADLQHQPGQAHLRAVHVEPDGVLRRDQTGHFGRDRCPRQRPRLERAVTSRNDVKMPWGNFVSNLAILRVDYAVSPRATIRSLTQYNSLTHEVTNSVRFNFIYRPGSDLYVVYNDLQQTGLPMSAFAPSDRQIVVKLNYLLAR